MQPLDLAVYRDRLRTGFPLVNDHPDVAGVLRNPELLTGLGEALVAPWRDRGVTLIAAPEARGPIVGALAASALGVGLALVRKADRNHPGADVHLETGPTWRGGTERFQGRSFDYRPDDRVLLIDDWVTTGSSLRAASDVVGRAGATVVGSSVIVNKAEQPTLERFGVTWLVAFDEIGP